MELHKFSYKNKFTLENGKYLPEIDIVYHTAGTISANQDNVIWICHALTANSDVCDWWSGLVGEGKLFSPDKYFIICANILGSCYGTTGPLSINSETGKPYYLSFPDVTVKDMVKVHELLRMHLGIKKIHTIVGGSIGSFQSLEWAIENPDIFEHLIFIAGSAKISPWATAFNESQRMALLADETFLKETNDGGAKGLAAARSIALLSYRNAYTYNLTQQPKNDSVIFDLPACSYQQYQGEKLVKRFNAYSYFILSKAVDSQNVGRSRGGVEAALQKITAKTLVVGVTSDLLFPIIEQKFVHENVNHSSYVEIDSVYGHDGFLIESDKLTDAIVAFYTEQTDTKKYKKNSIVMCAN